MANQAYPVVNEHECSWADIEVTINVPDGAKVPLLDLESINWSRQVETGESRGTSGGRPMKRTAGSVSYEASGSASRSSWMLILEALEQAAIAAGQTRGDEVIVSGISFNILIQHTPLGSTRIYTTRLTGCRFLGDSSDMSQGNEADVIELTLNPMSIATKSASGNWIVLR